MSTKVPIYLKRGSRKGKKEKLRDILSSDMISPPLGDFRHTIHIGSGGQSDTFGDISFLQGKFHLLPRAGAEPAGPEPFEFARAATMSGAEAAAAAASPLLKNAISLPALGGAQALTLPAAQAPPKPPRLHLDEAPVSPVGRANGEAEAPVSPVSPQHGRANGEAQPLVSPVSPEHGEAQPPVSPVSPERGRATGEAQPPASHAGSLLSLHVDLGPSILDEVLQVMERHQAERGGGARHEVLT